MTLSFTVARTVVSGRYRLVSEATGDQVLGLAERVGAGWGAAAEPAAVAAQRTSRQQAAMRRSVMGLRRIGSGTGGGSDGAKAQGVYPEHSRRVKIWGGDREVATAPGHTRQGVTGLRVRRIPP